MKGIEESVYNEYFCMRLAREVGLDVPDAIMEKQEVILKEIDGKPPSSKIHRRVAMLIERRANSFKKIGLE